MLRIIFCSILVLGINSSIFCQTEFMDYCKLSMMGSKSIGKKIHKYEGNNIRLYSDEYKSIDIKLSDLQNFNHADIVDDLNACPNIIFAKFDFFPGFKRVNLESIKSFPFDSLKYIKHLYVSGVQKEWETHEPWEKLLNMPSLEYFTLVSLYLVDNDKNFQGKFHKKLKGVSLINSMATVDFTDSRVEELSFSTKKGICDKAFESLKHNKFIRKLRLGVDTLTLSTLENIFLIPNLEWLELTPNFFEDGVVKRINSNNKLLHIKLSDPPIGFLEKININLSSLDILSRKNPMSKYYKEIERFKDIKVLKLSMNNKNDTILDLNFLAINRMKHLELNGSLKMLNPTLGSLSELQSIDLSSNKIIEIPFDFSTLKELREVNLAYNKIKEKLNFSGLSELEKLMIQNNELTEFPIGMSTLMELKEFNLSNNKLVELPNDITQMNSLESLTLSGNYIKKMPKSISSLSSLKELRADNNCLEILPSDIGYLPKLEKLWLRSFKPYKPRYSKEKVEERPCNNNIQKLPNSMIHLEQLESLWLQKNTNLTSNDVFTVLNINSENLKVILSDCEIYNLPERGWSTSKINSLDLSSNKIDSIPNDFFFTTVSSVDLNRNDLGIYDQKFESATHLKMMAYEKSLISKETLIKDENLVKTIVDVSSKSHRSIDENPILLFLPIAIELDSSYVFENIDAENYADALFKSGRYSEAITYYDISIEEDLSSNIQFTNSIASNINNRHKSYLEIGDTLSAIVDLKLIQSEFGIKREPQIFSLLYNYGMYEESLPFADSTELFYQNLLNKKANDFNAGVALSLLELYLITDQDLKFYNYLVKVSNEVFLPPYEKILKYIILIKELVANKSTEEEYISFVDNFNHSNYNNNSWNCDLVTTWSKKQSNKVREKITKLNQLVCPN